MIQAHDIKHISGEIRFDEDKRVISFSSYEKALAFTKDLVKNSQEITEATISVKWVQAGDPPKAEVENYLFEVRFLYNCYIAKDKKHFRSVLTKHRKNIVMASV